MQQDVKLDGDKDRKLKTDIFIRVMKHHAYKWSSLNWVETWKAHLLAVSLLHLTCGF